MPSIVEVIIINTYIAYLLLNVVSKRSMLEDDPTSDYSTSLEANLLSAMDPQVGEDELGDNQSIGIELRNISIVCVYNAIIIHFAGLSEIQLPQKIRRRGRPKGAENTVIGLPRRRHHKGRKPLPFLKRHRVERERGIKRLIFVPESNSETIAAPSQLLFV